jgi:hypothetical protein
VRKKLNNKKVVRENVSVGVREREREREGAVLTLLKECIMES